jgi:hypothetical protein
MARELSHPENSSRIEYFYSLSLPVMRRERGCNVSLDSSQSFHIINPYIAEILTCRCQLIYLLLEVPCHGIGIFTREVHVKLASFLISLITAIISITQGLILMIVSMVGEEYYDVLEVYEWFTEDYLSGALYAGGVAGFIVFIAALIGIIGGIIILKSKKPGWITLAIAAVVALSGEFASELSLGYYLFSLYCLAGVLGFFGTRK